MYFANWIFNYLPKPISGVYVQLGTCRPGVTKKLVANRNLVILFAWTLVSSVSLFSGWIVLSAGEAATQCTMLPSLSKPYCTYC